MASYPPYPRDPRIVPVPGPLLPPRSVVFAVWLMYAGAAAALADGIVRFAASPSADALRRSFELAHPTWSPARVSGAVAGQTWGVVLAAVLSAVLWLWMASRNKHGRPWARILSTVFFGIATVRVIHGSIGGVDSYQLLGILGWAIGLAAIMFLWQSGEYYTAMSRPGRPA